MDVSNSVIAHIVIPRNSFDNWKRNINCLW